MRHHKARHPRVHQGRHARGEARGEVVTFALEVTVHTIKKD